MHLISYRPRIIFLMLRKAKEINFDNVCVFSKQQDVVASTGGQTAIFPVPHFSDVTVGVGNKREWRRRYVAHSFFQPSFLPSWPRALGFNMNTI